MKLFGYFSLYVLSLSNVFADHCVDVSGDYFFSKKEIEKCPTHRESKTLFDEVLKNKDLIKENSIIKLSQKGCEQIEVEYESKGEYYSNTIEKRKYLFDLKSFKRSKNGFLFGDYYTSHTEAFGYHSYDAGFYSQRIQSVNSEKLILEGSVKEISLIQIVIPGVEWKTTACQWIKK